MIRVKVNERLYLAMIGAMGTAWVEGRSSNWALHRQAAVWYAQLIDCFMPRGES